jgi:hypothetical protein
MDDGRFAAVWSYLDATTSTNRQALFVGSIDGSTPIRLITVSGDTVDYTGDGAADAEIVSLVNPINRSWDLATDGMVYLNVDLIDSTLVNSRQAIVGFDIGTVAVAGCDDIDFNNDDVFPDDQDVVDFFNVLAGADCPACNDIDFNNNDVFPEDQDVIDFFNVLAGGQCP